MLERVETKVDNAVCNADREPITAAAGASSLIRSSGESNPSNRDNRPYREYRVHRWKSASGNIPFDDQQLAVRSRKSELHGFLIGRIGITRSRDFDGWKLHYYNASA